MYTTKQKLSDCSVIVSIFSLPVLNNTMWVMLPIAFLAYKAIKFADEYEEWRKACYSKD